MNAPDRAVWRSRGEVAVLGTGAALPGEPLATAALLDRLGDGLGPRERGLALAVARRLGVETRHVSRAWRQRIEGPADGVSNPDLAAHALVEALRNASLQAGDLGYLITHTATPAQPLPAGAAMVADRIGYRGPHIEIRQACTGFANALMIAFGLLSEPGAPPVAIVGSETGSVFLDVQTLSERKDQIVNLVQMGDGAGAIVLGPAERGGDRLSGAWYGAIGLGRAPGLQMARGGSSDPASGEGPLYFAHDFAAIAHHGARLFEAAASAAASQGLRPADADIIIPHQASGRIAVQLASHFGLCADRVFVNADRVGNTGSAAMWIALHDLRTCGRAAKRRVLALGAEATKYMHGGFIHDGA